MRRIYAHFVFRSLVSFGPKQRSIGEPAKTLEISNFRNTVGSLKRLLGRTASDPEITEVESKFTHVKLVDANGTVGAQVSIFCLLTFDFFFRGVGAHVCSEKSCSMGEICFDIVV